MTGFLALENLPFRNYADFARVLSGLRKVGVAVWIRCQG